MMIVVPCFDAKRCTCPQPFACTIPLVGVHAKCLTLMPTHRLLGTISKSLGKLLPFAWLLTGRIVRGHVAIIAKLSSHYVPTESTISGCDVLIPGLLPIFLHGCEIKCGWGLGTRLRDSGTVSLRSQSLWQLLMAASQYHSPMTMW